MDTNQLIRDRLENLQIINVEPFSDSRESLESRIFRIITRSKFRSAPLDPAIKKLLEEYIPQQIKEQKPLQFIYGMGGCKGQKTDQAPHINWAEFFHLQFLHENLGIIADIYEPGIEFLWSPDDHGVMIMNNYPQEWVDMYAEEFPKILEYFNNLSNKNILHTFKPASKWYKTYKEIHDEVIAEAEKRMKDLKVVEEIKKDWFKRAKNNYYNKDGLAGSELEKTITYSAVVNMAWLDADFGHREDFFESGIPVANFTAFPGCLYIQMHHNSNVQFWKGNGYLEIRGEKIIPRIVSRADWEKIEDQLKFVDTTILPDLPSLTKIPYLIKG